MSNPLNKIDYRDKDGDCSATDQEPLDQCVHYVPSVIRNECMYRIWTGACLRPYIQRSEKKNGEKHTRGSRNTRGQLKPVAAMINKFLCEVLRTLALLSFFVAVVFVCVLTWSEHNPEVRRALLDIQTVLFSDILGMY